MGIINKKKLSFNNLNYNNLIKYYKLFYLNLNIRETILNIVVNEKSYEYVIDDWNDEGWGTITYDVGFTYSSNVAATLLAQKLGKEIIYLER